MSETITQDPLLDTSGAGAGTHAEEAVEVKDLLNKVLNKDYPTNEAAIKSLTDTFSYVGEMGQKVKTLEQQLQAVAEPQVPQDILKQLAELQTTVKQTQFYNSNPEFNTPEAKALINEMGGDPETVVQKDVFKSALAAMKTSAEIEQSKSVLHSNPRLGIVQDKMTQAKEQMTAGNQGAAASAALDAVMEAFPAK